MINNIRFVARVSLASSTRVARDSDWRFLFRPELDRAFQELKWLNEIIHRSQKSVGTKMVALDGLIFKGTKIVNVSTHLATWATL